MFVVFDIETTGFSEITCDVIQFAYIMFDSNKNFVKAEQLYFYYEGMSWSEKAYEVHQISLDFLKKHKDKFKENLIKMYSVLNHANVVGHNAEHFDCPFCKTWLMRQGIRNLEYNIIQDTMLAFRPITKRPRIKLTKLIDFVDIRPEHIEMMMDVWFPNAESKSAHNAAYDVTATAMLTLRGIDRKLIAFEPLVKLNTEVISEDLLSDMNESSGSVVLDPNGFLFKVLPDNEYVCYSSDTSKYASYEMNVPKNVVEYYRNLGTLFPLAFEETSTVNDSVRKFELNYKDTIFTVTVEPSGASMLIETPYGTFSSKDVDIALIIKNSFGGV